MIESFMINRANDCDQREFFSEVNQNENVSHLDRTGSILNWNYWNK